MPDRESGKHRYTVKTVLNLRKSEEVVVAARQRTESIRIPDQMIERKEMP